MKKYIVAIGGGEIRKGETLAIDRHIVSLSRKKRPALLLIPTASCDSEKYPPAIQSVYGDKLGCIVDTLWLIRENPSKKEIRTKIESADIIYVGGGNTLKMMRLWRRLGVDTMLKKAYASGTIMCGISAGAICWFEYGHSDSMSFYNPDDWDYIRVKGLGLLKGTLCPHFNGSTKGVKRRHSFRQMMKEKGGEGVAIDNCAAVEYCNSQGLLISSKNVALAYIIRKKADGIWTQVCIA